MKEAYVLRYSAVRLFLFGLFTVLSFSAFASDVDSNDEASAGVRLRGFGTLGLAHSSSGEAGFVRDLSQPKGITSRWSGHIDSNLGLQANWVVNPDVELVGQAVSRYHYDGSFSPELSLAFVKWDPTTRMSLRLGRIGADFLMLADSRLIGYSYLSVRPPVDFFGTLFFSYLDGADASLTIPLESGIVRGKVFTGQTSEKAPYSLGIWDTSGSSVGGAVLSYQRGAWQFRGSAAGIRFSHSHGFSGLADTLRAVGSGYGYPSAIAAAEAIAAENTVSAFYSAGFVYDDGPLLIQGMLNRITSQSAVFQNSRAAYLLAGYRLGALTPYAGVSRVRSTHKNHSTGLPAGGAFDPLIQGFDTLMAATAMNQKTWILGMRWDVQPNTALKLQWDAVRGTPDSPFLLSFPTAQWNGKTDVLSVTLDFVF